MVDAGIARSATQNPAHVNRQQWIESFEGQLSILRPHLTQRILATLRGAAWHEVGVAGVDPIKAAKALSIQLDRSMKKPPA